MDFKTCSMPTTIEAFEKNYCTSCELVLKRGSEESAP